MHEWAFPSSALQFEIIAQGKMMLVLASLTLLFLAPATGQGLVKVGFYGEALCPYCIGFITGPLTVAFKEV